MQWQKVDQTGAAVDEEDINDENPANNPVNGGDGTGEGGDTPQVAKVAKAAADSNKATDTLLPDR